jgi:hypothetical protein
MDGYGRWCCRYGLGCLGLVGWSRELEGGRRSPSKGCCGVKELGVGVEMEWSGLEQEGRWSEGCGSGGGGGGGDWAKRFTSLVPL